jgi:hypothetical protein
MSYNLIVAIIYLFGAILIFITCLLSCLIKNIQLNKKISAMRDKEKIAQKNNNIDFINEEFKIINSLPLSKNKKSKLIKSIELSWEQRSEELAKKTIILKKVNQEIISDIFMRNKENCPVINKKLDDRTTVIFQIKGQKDNIIFYYRLIAYSNDTGESEFFLQMLDSDKKTVLREFEVPCFFLNATDGTFAEFESPCRFTLDPTKQYKLDNIAIGVEQSETVGAKKFGISEKIHWMHFVEFDYTKPSIPSTQQNPK